MADLDLVDCYDFMDEIDDFIKEERPWCFDKYEYEEQNIERKREIWNRIMSEPVLREWQVCEDIANGFAINVEELKDLDCEAECYHGMSIIEVVCEEGLTELLKHLIDIGVPKIEPFGFSNEVKEVLISY